MGSLTNSVFIAYSQPHCLNTTNLMGNRDYCTPSGVVGARRIRCFANKLLSLLPSLSPLRHEILVSVCGHTAAVFS